MTWPTGLAAVLLILVIGGVFYGTSQSSEQALASYGGVAVAVEFPE